MKKFLFLLCALFFGLSAHSQDTENVSFQKVVSFRGSFTTAERDLLDVPVGDVWMIYNSTTAILEYAREDDVWGAVGGGAADNLGANADRGLFTVSGAGTLATLNLNTIDSTHIKNGSIESNDFADNSITTAKILNGTIVGADIANDAILSGKIADGTILPADLDAINAPVVGYHLALDASNQFVWVTPTAGSVAALADLSDVSSATQGAGNVLISNGTSFGSRQLIEADISDLQHTINTDNQNARQVAVLDAGARFDSINVEGVLEELYDKWVVGNDDQVLTFTSPNLSIENGNSVDLSALQDGTGTDDQTAAEVPVTTTNFNGNLSAADTNVQLALETLDDLVAGGSQTLSFTSPNLSISGGNSVDISAVNTDAQTLSIATNNLSITGGNSVSLAPYLDNTDSQTLSFTSPNLSISGGNSVDLSALQDGTGTDDQTAAEVPSTPSGNLAASNVQAALDELQSDIDTRSVGAHTVNTDSQTLTFTSPNLSISGGNSVNLSALDTNTQRTDEEIQDVAGAMATGNTETLITVTYQDADGTMDYVVNSDLSLYNNATSNFSTGAHTVDTDDQTAAEVPSTPSGNLAASNVQAALNELQSDIDTRSVGAHTVNTDNQTLSFTSPNLSISGGNSVSLAALDTNTQRTDEEIQDVVGAMVTTTNTETLITVTYQDATNDIDFVVNSDLSLYNNATSNFSTGAHTVDTDDQTATEVPSTPSGNLAASNVQAALNELQTDIDGRAALSGATFTGTVQFNGIVNWNLGASAGNNLTMSENELQAVGLLDITRVGAGTNTIRQRFTSDTNFSIGPTVGGNALSYDYNTSTWNYKGSEVSYGAHTVNTDAQTLSFVSPNLSITGGNSVDLSGLVSGNYLPLTGGTLTGTTTINNDNGFLAPYFRSVIGGGTAHSTSTANNFDTEDHTAPTYSFWTSSNTTGSTGFPTATGQAFWVKGADDPRSFAFWKTNTDNDPDGLYSGYMNAGSWVWNEMWTSGSDGSGSGLDADLLDGIQLAENTNQGPTWSRVPWMRSDGVMEFGVSLDFHLTSAVATDYDMRLQAANNTTLRLIPGGTTSVMESYVGSQDWSRLGSNTSGGYIQLSDGLGGSTTTIRGYSDSDFYTGIRLHQGADLIMGTDAGSWRFDYITNNLTIYPGSTSGVFYIANSALSATFSHTTSTGATVIGGSSPSLTMAGLASFTNQTLSSSTASTTKDTGALIIQNGGLGVEGAINAGGDVTAFATSDRRLKNNMRPISGATEKVLKLSGYEFDWDEYKQDLYQGHDIGLMAQEVRRVIPSAVRTGSNGYLQVDYRKAVPLLVEAIKEQEARIEALEKAVAKLLEQ